MAADLRIDLLGGLRVLRPPRVIARFRSQKTAALLAFLAYHRERPHPREALIELLWPGVSPEAGRRGLSRELSSLRQQLEPPGVEAGSVVVADRTTVRIAPEAAATDVGLFREALAAADRARGDERRRRLREALELHAGELLPALHEDWVVRERERLRAAFLGAARALAAELDAQGDRRGAVDVLYRALGADPLSEEAHRDLMRIHADAGDPRAALAVYAELERTLARELGAPPAPTTGELARAIEERARPARPSAAPWVQPLVAGTLTLVAARDPSGRDPLPPGLVLEHEGRGLDGGPHKLVAFARASDALACALAAEREARRGATGVRFALDTGEVAFEGGRASGPVLERVARLLEAAAPGQVLCSEETAVLLRRELDPGVQLADLGVFRVEGVAGPQRLFQALAGDAPGPVRPERARHLSSPTLPLELNRFFGRDRELAALAEELLPGRRRLVTVRGPGGIGKTRLALQAVPLLSEAYRGAVVFVPLADLADARAIPAALLAAIGAPALAPRPDEDLLETAVRSLPSPALVVLDNLEHLTEEAAPTVRRLLERAPGVAVLATSRQLLGLSGERDLPLAPLEVPAADADAARLGELASVQLFLERARAVRPDLELGPANRALVAELVTRLEGVPLALALAAGRTHVLSLEELLARVSERLLDLASRQRDVPARHRTLRAAIEASHRLLPPGLQRLFARLSVFRGGFSLEAAEAVTGEPASQDELAALAECSLISGEPEGSRFRMLETLREFAREQLSPGELLALERRHAEHFRAFAETATSALLGPERGAWLERLGRERENLEAALAWARERPEPELALGLAAYLGRVWLLRGPVARGLEVVEDVLARSPSRSLARADAVSTAGGLAYMHARLGLARARMAESLELYRELGERKGVATALSNLAMMELHAGELEAATAHLEAGLALLRELGETSLLAAALNNLARLAQRRGRQTEARARSEESLALARAEGNRAVESRALGVIASASLARGELDRARAAAEEAVQAARAAGAELELARALLTLAAVRQRDGALARGRAALEESHGIFDRLTNEHGAAYARFHLARQCVLEGDLAAAGRELDHALAAARRLGDAEAEALFRSLAGDLARRQEDPAAARAHHAASLAWDRDHHETRTLVAGVEGLAWVARVRGLAPAAARLLGAAARLREELETPPLPREAEALDRERAALVALVGEDAFARETRAGRELPRADAIALALDAG